MTSQAIISNTEMFQASLLRNFGAVSTILIPAVFAPAILIGHITFPLFALIGAGILCLACLGAAGYGQYKIYKIDLIDKEIANAVNIEIPDDTELTGLSKRYRDQIWACPEAIQINLALSAKDSAKFMSQIRLTTFELAKARLLETDGVIDEESEEHALTTAELQALLKRAQANLPKSPTIAG